MNTLPRVLILCVLAIAATVIIIVKSQSGAPSGVDTPPASAPAAEVARLPRLVDLGAGKCIPCKMMEPILEELKQSHADHFTVEFIDVWKNASAGEKYGIRVIPTQIFYDADGAELFRHEGFFSKADILAKWSEFGVGNVAAGQE